MTVVWDKRACFSILKCKRINNKQEVNSTNHNHNVFLIDHKNKICRLHPERIFSFLLSRRNMFVMSMGITVSYHINNIECTPLHIFPNPQATSDNMRLCVPHFVGSHFCLWKHVTELIYTAKILPTTSNKNINPGWKFTLNFDYAPHIFGTPF